jgi:hypothetical protein
MDETTEFLEKHVKGVVSELESQLFQAGIAMHYCDNPNFEIYVDSVEWSDYPSWANYSGTTLEKAIQTAEESFLERNPHLSKTATLFYHVHAVLNRGTKIELPHELWEKHTRAKRI